MDGAVLAEAGPNAEAGIFSVLRRVLCTGNAGNAMFGGPLEARDGRGSAVAMMSLSDRQEREGDAVVVGKEEERRRLSQQARESWKRINSFS